MSNLVYAGTGSVLPSIVRQFNMLRPARWSYLAEGVLPYPYVGGWENADYFKDWLPFNLQALNPGTGPDTDTVTFGAFTTAPDGTTDTARLIVENTTNNEHSVLAGLLNHNQSFYGKVRFAGVFKYAGRRIVMQMTTGTQINAGVFTGYGCKAVFDLQNGQVAQELTYFGTVSPQPWVLYPAQIQAVGNGWYLCYIEAQVNRNVPANLGISLFTKVSLDNSSGTASESSIYAGNGASGVYAWRSNLMPSRAWTMPNTVAFFDDFDDDTRSNMDLTYTKDPNYTWFLQEAWPGWDYDHPFNMRQPPETAAVADSAVSVTLARLGTATSTWDHPSVLGLPPDTPDRNYSSGYVGRTFPLQGIFECRFKWVFPFPEKGGAFWGATVEWLTVGRYTSSESWVQGREMDWAEIWRGTKIHIHNYTPLGSIAHETYRQIAEYGATWSGVSPWRDNQLYASGIHVERLGSYYTSLVAINVPGNPPETTPLEWGPFNEPTVYGTMPIPPVNDYEQFNDYQCMSFPYTVDEPGQVLSFWNNGFCSFGLVYGPTLDATITNGNTDHLAHLTDHQTYTIFLGGDPLQPFVVDWVKVRQ